MEFKLIVCVDFDGVIHSYERGWQGGEIYGTVVPGFFDWWRRAEEAGLEVKIYSSRSKEPVQIAKMRTWLEEEAKKAGIHMYLKAESGLFVHEKPPAHLTIDDRAIQFKGDWNERELQPEAIKNFKPWTQKQGGQT